MSAPILTLTDVGKRFGSIQALSDITFEVLENELLVVLGPTGAGKTTLLRTIAGLENPDKGHLTLYNKDITASTPAQRDVALVFQNFSLYPNKTVRENLAFPLRAPGRNFTEDEIGKQVNETAQILHITTLLDRPANRLSGGEMQRVAIGRAIVRRPQLFLMDEPLTNLDAKLRETLRVEIIRLQRDLRTPMIYVTHDQTEALSMADRIVVLSEGRILQTGSPKEIYSHPKTPDIARQLGYPPINLIQVHSTNGHWQTQFGTSIMPAETNQRKATLGIRPEVISTQGGRTPAQIKGVEDMGPATILLVTWAGEHIRILVSGESKYKPGDEIYPATSPSDILIWQTQ
ncbi:MAG: ABC transporter ATP-binding protein [Candidatus Latescibacteria bacterium]|jgi:multiple sugar transport system ATP-binding protein|nr:ABC transporter ATP-binding protein [Candidatus Latescibacterota bacterium]MBT4137919.1 ABC transporter ATP-binding protein [Candidatus Latescibacterota bacterium]